MKVLPKNTIIEDGINDNNVIYTIYANGDIHCFLNLFGVSYFNVFKNKTKDFINKLSIKNLLLLDE